MANTSMSVPLSAELLSPLLYDLIPKTVVGIVDQLLVSGNGPDLRVLNWPLMNFYSVLGIVFAYLFIVLCCCAYSINFGKMELRIPLLIHNASLFFLSLYMTIEIVRQAIMNHYSLWGNGMDLGETGLGMARVLYIFYLSKVLEFGDTVFMALKGNYRQITFLHLYHHGSIFLIWWFGIYFVPGGESYFSAALNSFVHVFMYFYYGWTGYQKKERKVQVSNLDRPDFVQNKTWMEPAFYKPYITGIQLGQFAINAIQASVNLYFGPIPNYDMRGMSILFFYMLTMLVLFGQFFIASYLRPKKIEMKESQEGGLKEA